jgi:hypothetical protein
MTILGHHGVDEVRHLMRTAEFRMERAKALINRLEFSKANVALVKEWDSFVDDRWKQAHDSVLSSLITLRLDNPGAAEAFIPAEREFQIISKAINVTPGFIAPGDLTDLIRRLEQASGTSLDEAGHPLPDDFDPDLETFKRADVAIRGGEAAVKKLADSLPNTGSLLSRVPWWGWAIGVGAVGAAGYSVVKTGQQVNAKAKRDTDYIHETFTSKVLPGYKG